MDELERWLLPLRLGHLAAVLRANDVDLAILPELSEADLEQLGFSLGQRKRLLKAAASLPHTLSAPAPSPTPMPNLSATSSAERRQLTVMFCDLVGSTALATRLDPEDLREVISAYHRCVAATVAQFDGFVAKYMGDGVLIYFGYPLAHENDAERAIRAGLALVDAIARLQASERLQVRVGIATGLVVVGDLIGDGAAQEQAVVGETPNLAARLQSAAEPDTVVVDQSVRRLLGNLFECRDLGALAVKGFAEPVQAWQVLNPSMSVSRFEAFHAGAALTPLVGREQELEQLLGCWEHAKAGLGRVMLLSGEPGIGKSRLAAAIHERIKDEAHLVLRYFCSPFHTDSALYPIIGQLEHAAGFEREDTVRSKRAKLEALLARSSASAEDVALLSELLSLSADHHRSHRNLTPQQKRERTLAALMRQLDNLSQQSPVLMVFEDAHWSDPSSLDFLDFVVKRVQHSPVLLIITFRPELQPPWFELPHVTTLTLGRLSPSDGAALAELVANGKALPPEILRQVVARTDGVPLFAEELTKVVLESNLLREEEGRYVLDGPLPPLAIPTTLHASLVARLDRLVSVREVAQIAATIGREFSYELLGAVVSLPDEQLRQALDRLAGAELIFAHGTPPCATYTFKHALVQDAAYATLLRSTRQQLHAHIAEVIEEHFPETVETQPELVAHHCMQARLTAKAVAYWYKAGQLAIRRSAMAEALTHISKALDLISLIPISAERHRQEFRLQLARAGALALTSGWASPQMGEAYFRACEISRLLEDLPELELVTALCGRHVFHQNRAELDAAQETAHELQRLAESLQSRAALTQAHRAAGVTLTFRGEFDEALAHHAQVLADYDAAILESPIFFGTTNVRVTALSFMAWVRLFQGHFDEALRWSREALEKAHDLSHPYSLAFSLHVNCVFSQICQDWRAVRDRSALLVSVAAEHGFPHLQATGTFFQGWAAFASGQIEAGLMLMRQGLAAKRSGGAELKVPYYLGLLADAYRQMGHTTDALPMLMDALDRVQRTGERWFEAELHRLKAEILIDLTLPQDAVREAEDSLQQALAVAQAQGAKLWELRAATSLAQLWHNHERPDEAYGLLAPTYGWFPEGLDKPDLMKAKTLLDELVGTPTRLLAESGQIKGAG